MKYTSIFQSKKSQFICRYRKHFNIMCPSSTPITTTGDELSYACITLTSVTIKCAL